MKKTESIFYVDRKKALEFSKKKKEILEIGMDSNVKEIYDEITLIEEYMSKIHKKYFPRTRKKEIIDVKERCASFWFRLKDEADNYYYFNDYFTITLLGMNNVFTAKGGIYEIIEANLEDGSVVDEISSYKEYFKELRRGVERQYNCHFMRHDRGVRNPESVDFFLEEINWSVLYHLAHISYTANKIRDYEFFSSKYNISYHVPELTLCLEHLIEIAKINNTS